MSSPTALDTTPLTRAEQDRHLWSAFRFHSRTFSLAACFLPRPVRMPVATLYLFCRMVDSIADHRIREVGAAAALDELHALRRDLDATLHGTPPAELLWERLAEVHAAFPLDPAPLYELIDGATWDLEGRTVETEADLVTYANLVGGCVGAMMLPFLVEPGTDPRSLDGPARALGIAMQITNILRDVGEDRRELGRVYLPMAWLRERGWDASILDAAEPPAGYAALMERAMALAERYYREGIAGIDRLPAGVRTGIRAAARMYREVLNEVRARGYNNLTTRAYVPLRRKLLIVAHDGYARRRHRLRTT